MTSDPASPFPRALIVAGVAVAERARDAPALARIPADKLEARTLPAHVHPPWELVMLLPSAGDEQLVSDVSEIAAARAHGPNDGPTPALPRVPGGPTA